MNSCQLCESRVPAHFGKMVNAHLISYSTMEGDVISRVIPCSPEDRQKILELGKKYGTGIKSIED